MTIVTVIKPFGGNFPITSPFGERIDPKLGIPKMHNGVDFGCPEGTPIRSVLDGKVFMSGWECDKDPLQGYGQRVWIESQYNGFKLLVVYAHLSQISKSAGEFISESGIIGFSGNTGKSTGPHLHLGCRIKDTNQFLDFDFQDTIQSTITIDGEVTKPWSMEDEVKMDEHCYQGPERRNICTDVLILKQRFDDETKAHEVWRVSVDQKLEKIMDFIGKLQAPYNFGIWATRIFIGSFILSVAVVVFKFGAKILNWLINQ